MIRAVLRRIRRDGRPDHPRETRSPARAELRFGAAVLLGLAWLGGAPASAASADAQARFTEARSAFDAADFPRALVLFEQALALGLEGPAIHYNIGVAAYRSGHLARAESAFREVARTPAMATLAHYNLGLVALQRQDEKAARAEFTRVAAESTDERLTALASRQLEKLPAPVAAVDPWSWYGRGGAGYDDNVALRSESIDGTGSGQGDAFAELLASGSRAIGERWRVDAAAGLLQYADLDHYDQSAFSLGGVGGFALGQWHLEAGAYVTRLALGGTVYERSLAATAQATRQFARGSQLRAQLRATSVDGEDEFAGLSGSRTELGLRYDWGWRAWSFGTHARGEYNDSDDAWFASRWYEVGARASWPLNPRWTLLAEGALRQTRHPAPEPGVPGWEDRRITLQAGATRLLWQQVQLFVRYEYEDNTSDAEGYDYGRNWVAASIEYWH
jgi:tetratricopeptide (TPR) repeat protein